MTSDYARYFRKKLARCGFTPAFNVERVWPSAPTIQDLCTVVTGLPRVSGAKAGRHISVLQIANLMLQIANLELSNIVSVNWSRRSAHLQGSCGANLEVRSGRCLSGQEFQFGY
jgi:hypothetical protein